LVIANRKAQLRKTQLDAKSSHVQNQKCAVYAPPSATETYAKQRRPTARRIYNRSNDMTRNLVAFAAALGVSGLFFAATLA
jgi:hypothetical protein